MENEYQFVEFNEFCPKCKYGDLDGFQDPCNDCLTNPANYGTTKPINFVDKNKED